MNPPVDYPVQDEAASADPKNDDMNYAALLDRHASKEIITEAMIQSACLSIETAQQFSTTSKSIGKSHNFPTMLSLWIRDIS